MSKIAAVCSNCDKASQEIYEDYTCAKCRIEYLEESLEIALRNERELSDRNEVNKKAIDNLVARKAETNKEELNYKIAYQTLLYELGLKKRI